MPYIYPQNYEVQVIEQELVKQDLAGRLGMQIMPIQMKNAGEVRWTQQDSYYGLQQFRGLNGEPAVVQNVGAKTYTYEPGVYGDFMTIDETELTKRAGTMPTDTTPIDVSDLVAERDSILVARENDRIEYNIWTILQSGILTLTKPGPNNSVVQYTDVYPIQQITAAVGFSNTTTASPIATFQKAQQTAIGRSVDFGSGATAYGTGANLFNILNNSNVGDYGGRRNQNGSTINNLGDLNNYWQAQNLPKLVAYDNGFYATPQAAQTPGPSNFTKFISDNKIVIVGKRPANAQVGNYMMTRNANNPNSAPGRYRYVKDRTIALNGERQTPPNIEVHRGHNGGPALLYPSAILVINC